MVQHEICHLLHENLKDERNIFYRKVDQDEDDKRVVPGFFRVEKDKAVKKAKICVEKRTAAVRDWLEYFQTIKYEYK